MKKIKLSYSPLYNAGDLFNKDLVEKLSNKKTIQTKIFNADMIAIGGAIFGLQYSNSLFRKCCQFILGIIYNKPIYIWGSGFLYSNNNNKLYRKNIKVCALRGEMTKQKLFELTGVKYDVPLADAGLLIDLFLENNIEKKYKIGLIPHMSQIEEPEVQKMKNNPDILLIDIRRSPIDVVKDIAACESIASSSLHGLIFADSLHIPSLHLICENQLPGGNFKFEDYYSCYGLKDNSWNLKTKGAPTKEDIVLQYRITPELVELKKKELLESFPKF